jgi:hypothetical protein
LSGGIFAPSIDQIGGNMQVKKLELWKKRRQQFRKSGLTRKAFCSKNRLKISTLDYWFARIGKLEKSQALVELKAKTIPVMNGSLEVVVGGRYRIEIRQSFDVQLFRELVTALESLG